MSCYDGRGPVTLLLYANIQTCTMFTQPIKHFTIVIVIGEQQCSVTHMYKNAHAHTISHTYK